jgi:hypothetical protein
MADTETLNFEQVWRMFQETREQMREADRQRKEAWEQEREADRQWRETWEQERREADRQRKEMQEQMREAWEQEREERRKEERKTERSIRETHRAIDRLSSRQGELIEHIVLPNILKKFNALGYVFTRAGPNVNITNPQGRSLTEVDVMLENGDYVLAVEVKTKPAVEDVRDHINRMEILRRYADEHQDKRKYLGAVAGGIMGDQTRDFALKTGFYVLEQSGDTVKLNAAPPPWEPRIW